MKHTRKILLLAVCLVAALLLGTQLSRYKTKPYAGIEAVLPHVNAELADRQWDSRDPVWSPDGTQIAFISGRNCSGALTDTDVFVMNADGSNPKNLTNDCLEASNPAWSPDGTKIAFTSNLANPTNQYAIRIYDFSTNQVSVLLDAVPGIESPYFTSPTWSPNGDELAFTMGPYGTDLGVFILHLADGSVRQVAENAWDPQWSASNKLIFTTSVPAPYSGGEPVLRLQVINPDGTESHQLADIDAFSGTWSPDGSKVLFLSYTNDWWEIFTANPDGSKVTQLTNLGQYIVKPTWGKPGILYHAQQDGEYGLYRLDPSKSLQTEQQVQPELGASVPRYPEKLVPQVVTEVLTNDKATGIVQLLRQPVGTYGLLETHWMVNPDIVLFDEAGAFAQINRSGVEGATIANGKIYYGWRQFLCVAEPLAETETCYKVTPGEWGRTYVTAGSVGLDGQLVAFSTGTGVWLLDTQAQQYLKVWNTINGIGETRFSLSPDGTELVVYVSWDTETLYRYSLQTGDLKTLNEGTNYGPIRFNGNNLLAVTGTNWAFGRFGSYAVLYPNPIGSGATSAIFDLKNDRGLFSEVGTPVAFTMVDTNTMLLAGFPEVTANVTIDEDSSCEGDICTTSYQPQVTPRTLWRCSLDGSCQKELELEASSQFAVAVEPFLISSLEG